MNFSISDFIRKRFHSNFVSQRAGSRTIGATFILENSERRNRVLEDREERGGKMRGSYAWSIRKAAIWATALMATGVLGEDILVTTGFNNCDDNNNSDIKVERVDIRYNNADKTVSFNVAGTSTREQNVTAKLSVTAFGQNVYQNEFNPCDATTFVQQLCPGMYTYF